MVNDLFLAQGYAVASSSLNVLDNNCSAIISAEAAMMVKEHFIETYGPVQHTIGWGGSGGAIQQYQIAEMYPGIVDGIIPGVSFPDPFTTLEPVTDCRLLNSYFAGAGSLVLHRGPHRGRRLPVLRHLPVLGRHVRQPGHRHGKLQPGHPGRRDLEPDHQPGRRQVRRHRAVRQPVRPRTGAPDSCPSTLDNVGVQYGLGALKAGAITPAQFAALNAGIGGMDYTGAPQAARTEGDAGALAKSYADDLLNSASQGLKTTPIIDQRTDLDQAGLGNDIHTSEWSYVMRARLRAANGTSANQVIITSGFAPGPGRRVVRLRTGGDGPMAHEHRGRHLAPQPAVQGDRRQTDRSGRRLLPVGVRTGSSSSSPIPHPDSAVPSIRSARTPGWSPGRNCPRKC